MVSYTQNIGILTFFAKAVLSQFMNIFQYAFLVRQELFNATGFFIFFSLIYAGPHSVQYTGKRIQIDEITL